VSTVKADAIDLFRQVLIFHAGASKQVERVRAAQEAINAELALDKWVDGRPPAVSRKAEYAFEYEFHFLLVAAAQLEKALRKLGLAGFDKDLSAPLKNLRDWYTHFEDPEGDAYGQFTGRHEGKRPDDLFISGEEVHIGGFVITLTQIEQGLVSIGSRLERYEALVLAKDGGCLRPT